MLATPIISLNLLGDKSNTNLNFIIDTGANCSLVDHNSISSLTNKFTPNNRNLSALGHDFNQDGYDCNLEMFFPDSASRDVNLYAIQDLEFLLKFDGINNLVNQCNYENIPVSPFYPKCKSDQLVVHGILGMDIITLLDVFELCKINNKSLFRISNGYIPVALMQCKRVSNNCVNKFIKCDNSCAWQAKGNKFDVLPVEHLNDPPFMSSEDSIVSRENTVGSVAKGWSRSKSRIKSNIIPKTVKSESKISSDVISKCVNFVFQKSENKNKYYSPLTQIFSDSMCEQGMENFFSLESVGIKNKISSYDEVQIANFKESIELKDNHYYVKLPWKEDILQNVPHNFEISKVLAKKVFKSNNKINKNNEYVKIFEDQLAAGIIEEIEMDDSFNYEEHIWIPHRPIIRETNKNFLYIQVSNWQLHIETFLTYRPINDLYLNICVDGI